MGLNDAEQLCLTSSVQERLEFLDIVGPHPMAPHSLGTYLTAKDEWSDDGVPHRVLDSSQESHASFVAAMKQFVRIHHTSEEMRERDRRRKEAIERLGFPALAGVVGRFPKSPNTQKGNWAEILLAEYIGSASGLEVPVYRLRYNPNIDQSMKGDDVLAFDLDAEPVRIIVGEAKFRGKADKAVVEEIVQVLLKSHRAGLPVSLQFVANRLFEAGNHELGAKVEHCSSLFALGKLQLDYVGLLVADAKAPAFVRKNTKNAVHRLAVLSLGLNNPEDTVCCCYTGLEES